MRFGAGRDVPGVVLVLTFGTGIGSGMFIDGVLVPNTELGHLEVDGKDAERRAAASARDREKLSWKEWAERVQRYLEVVVALFSPSLIIVGGGASRQGRQVGAGRSTSASRSCPPPCENEAGIVGAALVGAMAHPLT